jgi:acetolactate synthase-1/2/3 large subunit
MDDRLADRVREADLIVAVGGRLGEVPTRRYTLLDVPRPSQTLVHIHPDPDELGFVYRPDLPIACGVPELAAALRGLEPLEPRWRQWTQDARADYEANLRHEPMEGPVDLGEIMAFLRGRLPGDAVQTCGAGNFTVWAHRFAEFTQFGTQVCPRSGSMGYGVAAAVAAKLVHPDRIALCFTGDGDFVMSSPEFATAVQYELPIVVLLVNNGMYGTIRMHQERQFPGRVIGTDLANPDFPALARAYGGFGERVERTADFEAAFERALESGLPALLDLPVDPERISPRVTLSELQGRAR